MNILHENVDYSKDLNFRIWKNVQDTDYASHWHSATEIILPIENSYQINIYDECYNLSPGELLIIPSGELHEIKAPSSGSRLIFLFEIAFLQEFKSFSSIMSLLNQPIHITEASQNDLYCRMRELLLEMFDTYTNNKDYSELIIYSRLIDFFVLLGKHHTETPDLFPNVKTDKQKEYIRKFNSLMTYIDENYTSELNIDELSYSIGFSKFHFLRLFKQYTGMTLGEYITFRRVKASEHLLSNSDYSMSEIASLSGFTSVSTFNRIFKNAKRCSPTEYKLRNNTRNH